jgi:hypothetical protein
MKSATTARAPLGQALGVLLRSFTRRVSLDEDRRAAVCLKAAKTTLEHAGRFRTDLLSTEFRDITASVTETRRESTPTRHASFRTL